MEWIKENPTAFTFLVVFGISAILMITATIIGFTVQNSLKKKKSKIKNYTLGFEVNLKSSRIVYFERKNTAHQRTISLETFFQLLHKKDVVRIKLWLADLKKNFDFTDKYFETQVVSMKGDSFFLLLKAISFNEENQTVYLEGYQLSKMNPSQGRKRATNEDYTLIKRSQIESVFESLKYKMGYVFSVRFFYNNKQVINDVTIEKSVLYRLKNEVYVFASEDKNNKFVYDEYDDQIYLFDFKTDNDISATKVVTDLHKKLSIALQTKGFASRYGVAIGGINLALNIGFNDAIVKSSQVSDSARVNDLPFLLSDDDSENLQAFDKNLVEKVFENSSLKLLYRPIINIKTEQIVGYFSNVKVLDTHFESYFDIARYINKVDRNEELLSKVIQQFVSKFYFERPSNKARLFIQISLVDLDHLGNVLANINYAKDANLVLLFEESEVNANAFSIDLLTSQLNELTSLGYEIALLLKDENTLLEHTFYSVFNYFVIGSAMVSKIRDSSRVRLSNKFLIESLLQYKRPIVINDLDGWSSIDLFVKSGCTFLSGDDISPTSEMILPIEKAKIARLRKINN